MAAVESTFACVLAAVGQDPDAGWIVTVAAEEIGLVPPPLPVLPDWSPVAAYGGYHQPSASRPPFADGHPGRALLGLLLGLSCGGGFWGTGCDCFVF